MSDDDEPDLVICLGASAGGLEALEAFFKEVPGDLDCAYVVVQHLSPDFKSLMGEILSRSTKLPIRVLEDGSVLEKNHVHLIPPTKELSFDGLTARLEDRPSKGSPPLIIDHCFESLAKEFGPRAVAIVLSGTGSDGSRGIQNVADGDGLVIAQDPLDAKFDGMPRCAIDTQTVHLTLNPGEMPSTINRFRHDPDSGRTPLPSITGGEHLNDLERIHQALKLGFGVDFERFYKDATINRRIERRVKITHNTDITTYRLMIESDPNELEALYKDLLIGVTSFFRDPDAYEKLESLVFPAFLEHNPMDPIRIWNAGCASGEEVYSILILLLEYLEKNDRSTTVKVFATDLHRGSLERASNGIYSAADIQSVPKGLIGKYFKKVTGGFEVRRELREMVVFARHNLIEDAPFTRMDLVVCRNLLIYLNKEAQTKIFGLFGYSLQKNGFLFLGTSENLPEDAKSFVQIETGSRLYRKVRDQQFVTSFRSIDPSRLKGRTSEPVPMLKSKNPSEKVLDSLLSCFVTAGFLVNRENQLVYTVGKVSRYLALHSGRMTDDFLSMAPEDLRLHFAGAIRRTFNEEVLVDYGNISFQDPEEASEQARFRLRAVPVGEADGQLQFCFLSLTKVVEEEPEESGSVPAHAGIPELANRRIEELENEIGMYREGHQTVTEELESSNEELQSTNEELIASNEELQSTNEELQSVNEELYTVNAEFDSKNRELSYLTADLENFLQATRIGTIFLDDTYNIRRFTDAAAEVMNLREGDESRPIIHVTSQLGLDPTDLLAALKAVEREGKVQEMELEGPDELFMLLRILPYQDKAEALSGFVLTFIDISATKKSEREKESMSNHLRTLIEAIDGIVLTLDENGELLEASHTWEEYTGQILTKEGRSTWLHKIEGSPQFSAFASAQGELSLDCCEPLRPCCEHQIKVWNQDSGSYRHCLLRLSPLPEKAGWAALVIDLESEIQARLALEENNKVLNELTDMTSTAVFHKDLKGVYVSMNRYGAQLFNMPQKRLGNQKLTDFDLFPSEIAKEITRKDQEVLAGQSSVRLEEELVIKDGSTKVYSTTKMPLLDQEGKVYGLAGIATDITDDRQNQKIREQKVELERINIEMGSKNRQLDQFASVASHDLKQPLRIVSNYASILREDCAEMLSPEANNYLGRIYDAASRMNALLEAIHEYSQFGRQALHLSDVQPEDAVREVLDVLRLGQKTAVKFHLDTFPEIMADKEMLYQIYLNLIGNSVKFGASKNPQVWIYVRERGAARPIFGVRDNGIGIKNDYLERIFEPFERLHSRDEYEGHGIGLSIARSAVERHGGQIKISSEREKGTAIEFTFGPGPDWEVEPI